MIFCLILISSSVEVRINNRLKQVSMTEAQSVFRAYLLKWREMASNARMVLRSKSTDFGVFWLDNLTITTRVKGSM